MRIVLHNGLTLVVREGSNILFTLNNTIECLIEGDDIPRVFHHSMVKWIERWN